MKLTNLAFLRGLCFNMSIQNPELAGEEER